LLIFYALQPESVFHAGLYCLNQFLLMNHCI